MEAVGSRFVKEKSLVQLNFVIDCGGVHAPLLKSVSCFVFSCIYTARDNLMPKRQ